jgi:long-chain acyl-CoA synthetase
VDWSDLGVSGFLPTGTVTLLLADVEGSTRLWETQPEVMPAVLVGRTKDMIIRGGENIYPGEIEAVVNELPQIAEAAVVGRPDPVYGEQPVLFVSLYPGATLSVDAIEKHMRVSLSKYKLPAEITVLDDLPKNPIGKIDKPRLRQLAQTR